MSPVETMAELSHELARSGLVVADCFSDSELSIARPASAGGTAFRGRGGTSMVGIGNAMLQTDAPTCTVRRRQKSPRWVVDISEAAFPGPGPVYFHEAFETASEACEVVKGCYFGDGIDFNNASLNSWFGSES